MRSLPTPTTAESSGLFHVRTYVNSSVRGSASSDAVWPYSLSELTDIEDETSQIRITAISKFYHMVTNTNIRMNRKARGIEGSALDWGCVITKGRRGRSQSTAFHSMALIQLVD
jgi:hypothetical protein